MLLNVEKFEIFSLKLIVILYLFVLVLSSFYCYYLARQQELTLLFCNVPYYSKMEVIF